MAVAQLNEDERNLRSFAQRYPRIHSPVWNWFRVGHLDQLIFDRCSRNSAKLSPSTPSSPPSLTSTIHALQATLSAQPCGSCDYDSTKPAPEWPSLHPPPRRIETRERGQISRVDGTPNVRASNAVTNSPINSINNNNVSLTTFGKQRERNGKTSQKKPTKQQQQIIKTTQKPEETTQNYNNIIRQKHLELQERERLIREREQRQRENEEKQRKYWLEQQQKLQQLQQKHVYVRNSDNTTTPTVPSKQKTRQFPEPTTRLPVNYASDPYRNKNNNYFSRREEQQKQNRIYSSPSPPQPVVVAGPLNQRISTVNNRELLNKSPQPAPLYPEGSENNNNNNNNLVEDTQDYYNYEEIWTTESPPQNLQIPKPITTKIEPTQPSSSSFSSSSTNQQDKNFGFELPCTGFSDESCFQQQTQLRPNEIHRCCRGRILFSDLCVSGKCSNTTIQLCCIQRFLQAKLTCCSDERLAETKTGDHFSRCCFDNFVDSDDVCCPREYANEQWRSVHELCLPNVEMDLSEVKVPVPLMGTSLITEFDFAKTDKWRFECRYGGHTRQFSYFEQPTSQEGEENNEGESEEIN
uniref:DB domain-containing protein n=1 Tax=Meloidogyne incognita TaxID=6306 RepID=A0A914N002_MELIC